MTSLQIERIEAIPLRMPLPRPLRAGTVTITSRSTVLTRIYTSDGIVGECFSNNELSGQAEIVRMIHDEITPLLKGRSVHHVEACWQAMYPITRDFLRDRRMAIRAVACVDAAMWDAFGKSVDMPLHRAWGGMGDDLPVVAMGAYPKADDDLGSIRREMASLREQGFAGCKLKVGSGSPEHDAERVRAAREGAGPGFWLMPDANQGWSLDQAVTFAKLVEPLDIRWLEEPCHWHNDKLDLARLRSLIGMKICAGQSEITLAGCRELMAAGSIDLCNFDPSWGGGPTEWRRVAATAHSFGIGALSHLEPQVGAALAASVPNGLCVEMMQPDRDPLYHAIVQNKPAIADGRLTLSPLPGWGLQLDEALIRKIRCN